MGGARVDRLDRSALADPDRGHLRGRGGDVGHRAGVVDRLDLGRPDGDTYVPAPIAMHVSKTTDMLYLASATTDPLDPESTVIYGFSTAGPMTLDKSVVVNGMQHVTSMAEDSQTAALWVAGFNKLPEPFESKIVLCHLA